MRQLILWGSVGVVVVVGALAIVAYRSGGSLLARAIESYGSRALGAPVAVDGVELLATEGRITLRGVRVQNPPGFSAEEAFGFDEVTVQVDPSTLLGDLVIVREILVRAPRARLEVLASGDSNVDRLRANAGRAGASGGSADAPSVAAEAGADDASADVRVRVDRVRVQDGRMVADLTAFGEDERTVNLPPLEIPKIGGAEGVRPDQLAAAAAQAWMRHLQRSAVRASLPQKLDELIEGAAGDEIGDALRGILEAR